MHFKNFGNMKSLNRHIEGVRQSGSVALNDKVSRLKSEGRNIISLNSGDPNFNTPEAIIKSAYETMTNGFTHYSNSRGIPHLRKAVAKKISNFNDGQYDSESEILITCGAVHAFYLALKTILNEGDEVLVPDPTWMTHANLVSLLGGKAVRVPALPENNFFPSIENLANLLTSKTKSLVINSPSNPTGAVAGKEYLNELAAFAKQNNIFIISDEVYERIIFEGKKNTSLASFESAKNNLIILNSFSKTYAMTGWRIGYLAAPKFIVDEAIKASQYSITSLPPFIQYAAVTALTDSTVEAEVEKMITEYEHRRNLVKEIFVKRDCNKIELNVPEGAFYYFMDISKLSVDSNLFCAKLLDEQGIALVPGSIYGKYGEGYIRFSLASSTDDIITGANGIIDWIN
jgi:aspartate/methionine/tyrosine aminotransferase